MEQRDAFDGALMRLVEARGVGDDQRARGGAPQVHAGVGVVRVDGVEQRLERRGRETLDARLPCAGSARGGRRRQRGSERQGSWRPFGSVWCKKPARPQAVIDKAGAIDDPRAPRAILAGMFIPHLKDATPQALGQSELRHLLAYDPERTQHLLRFTQGVMRCTGAALARRARAPRRDDVEGESVSLLNRVSRGGRRAVFDPARGRSRARAP